MTEIGTLTAVEALKQALAEMSEAIVEASDKFSELTRATAAAESELMNLEAEFDSLAAAVDIMEERSQGIG